MKSFIRAMALGFAAAVIVAVILARVRSGSKDPGVVLYCAQDQVFAEPLLAGFHAEASPAIRPVWDSEAVKTVGLANRLLGEMASPRADVWWSNEEFRTRQLAARGVFGTNRLGNAGLPFVAFGSRHRCLVYDPGHLPAGGLPASLVELTNARFAGRISMAFPLFGTTSTHLLALREAWGAEAWRGWCRALAANRPFLEEGNSQVVQRVARGEALLGLTDSDDFASAVRGGAHLAEIPLGRDGLAIPNTVALVRPAAPGSVARRLAGFIASDATIARLSADGALDPAGMSSSDSMVPDWTRMLASLDAATSELEGIFRR